MQPASPWQSYQETGYFVEASEGFGRALRDAREAHKPRRISQSKLALEAGFDHSYISRLEQGTRKPTLEAVERISKALGHSKQEADALRMAAGYMPTNQSSVYLHQSTARLDSAMSNLAPELYQWVEQTIEAVLGHIERASNRHG